MNRVSPFPLGMVLLIAACGPPPDSAADQCRAFDRALCERVVDCSDRTLAECLVDVEDEKCAGVIVVSGPVQDCLRDMPVTSCEALLAKRLPSSCEQVQFSPF